MISERTLKTASAPNIALHRSHFIADPRLSGEREVRRCFLDESWNELDAETVERLRTQCSLADPVAEEFENILAYLCRYGFRGQGSGCGRSFLIGI